MAAHAVKTPTLIYCGGGNPRLAQIAMDAGYKYGSQLPETVYGKLTLADQDWKRPNRTAYMAALAIHRPVMATVLDLECAEQLAEVLSWAEEAAQYSERVMIIPKVFGIVSQLPRHIGGREVVLGYSVPTRFGGTQVPIWEFADWPVHLLGGSPHAQMHIWRHLQGMADVISADGNLAQKMAVRWCQFWVNGTARYAANRWWPTLSEADGIKWADDAPYEAFRRSCENVMAAWVALGAN